jgi:hypothetical protein
LQPVQLEREFSRNGGNAGIARSHARTFGVARNRHALELGMVAAQPVGALRQRLRMGTDLA